jgi:hypothetical protein
LTPGGPARTRAWAVLALPPLAGLRAQGAAQALSAGRPGAAVNQARHEITIKHGDIPGFMPAMIMTYPAHGLVESRAPGETISAILEVRTTGTLVEITHTGTAPPSTDSNTVALAAGVLDAGDNPRRGVHRSDRSLPELSE